MQRELQIMRLMGDEAHVVHVVDALEDSDYVHIIM